MEAQHRLGPLAPWSEGRPRFPQEEQHDDHVRIRRAELRERHPEGVRRGDGKGQSRQQELSRQGLHRPPLPLHVADRHLGDRRIGTPQKTQIRMLKFYNESWKDFEDYIGPKPPEDPTTWITVRPDGTFPYYRYAPYGRKTGQRLRRHGDAPTIRTTCG